MPTILAAAVAALFVAAPEKQYVKLDQPVNIRFLVASPEAQPTLNVVGLKAAEIPNLLTIAKPQDIKDAFQLYSFDGKLLDPVKVTEAPDLSKGILDLSTFYPQIRQPGTYIFTWKAAQPLVIETLANPGRSPKDLQTMIATSGDEFTKLPKEQQTKISAQFGPTIIHIVPLSYAVIHTDKGDLKATFWYDVAPHTVDNYISLAQQGFYSNSVFHRIMKGFMIQGGDSTGSSPDRAGSGGPGYQIMAEFNDKPHERGTLSMARSQAKDSAGSQFFVVHQKAPHLDHAYTGFGQVFDGLDALDKIADTPNSGDNGDVAPKDRPTLKSIEILPATPDMYGIKTK